RTSCELWRAGSLGHTRPLPEGRSTGVSRRHDRLAQGRPLGPMHEHIRGRKWKRRVQRSRLDDPAQFPATRLRRPVALALSVRMSTDVATGRVLATLPVATLVVPV